MLECCLDHGLDLLDTMGILAITPMLQPTWKVKVLGTVDLHRVTVELVNGEGVVAICSELVCDELRVLPDANHVGEKEDCGVFVNGVAASFSDIDFGAAEGGGFSGG